MMRGFSYVFLLSVFLILGCISNPNDRITTINLREGMTIDEFLNESELTFEGANDKIDHDGDGVLDEYGWEITGDDKIDIAIIFNRETSTTTPGFHQILLINHETKGVQIGSVGKESGKVRRIQYSTIE